MSGLGKLLLPLVGLNIEDLPLQVGLHVHLLHVVVNLDRHHHLEEVVAVELLVRVILLHNPQSPCSRPLLCLPTTLTHSQVAWETRGYLRLLRVHILQPFSRDFTRNCFGNTSDLRVGVLVRRTDLLELLVTHSLGFRSPA